MYESTMLFWIAVVLMTFFVEGRLISFREIAKDTIYKIIMSGLEGDLEELQTQEVNITRGKAEGDNPRVTLTSWFCHSSRSPEGQGM